MVKICAFFSCKSRRCQKPEKTRETDDWKIYKIFSIVSIFLPFILSFIFCNFFCIRIHTDDWYRYHIHTLNE